jgi:hypothetical protein
MFLIMIRYLGWLVVILIVAVGSYWKGYEDHRIKSLTVNVVENYANLGQLDSGHVRLCRAGLYTVLSGDIEAYQKLSTNRLLYNPALYDKKTFEYLKEADAYVKEKETNKTLIDQNTQSNSK